MESKETLLASLPIFKNMNDDELEALAEIAPEFEFEADSVIAYQRDVAHSLYVVCSGRLFASTLDERGIVRDSKAYTDGKYFGESWLFKEGQHTATVRATEPGQLIIIKGEDLLKLLEDDPEMVEGFKPDTLDGEPVGLQPENWIELTEQIAGVELPEDQVVLKSRRSRWVFIGNTFVRLLILTVWLVVYLGLLPQSEFLQNPLTIFFLLILPVFFLILSLGFSFLDWFNDYLLLTQRQLLHYEFNLGLTNFGRQVQRTPLEQIQSTGVLRPSLFSNLFRIGTIRVTTGAQGGTGVVEFDKLSRPERIRDKLEAQRKIAREEAQKVSVSRTQSTIRQAVEGHFQVAPPYKMVENEEDEEINQTTKGSPAGRIGIGLSTRVQTGGNITYRKSRVFLFLSMKWGLLFLLLLVIGAWIMSSLTVGLVFWAVWGLFFIINVFVLIYEFLDWHNDQYMLTDRHVIDIDKLPFGLRSSQKQAELVNIQNVTTDQSGIPAYIFRYGNVIIETAGATADIAFERVTNPRQVQQEIFERREQQRRRRTRREEENRLQEFAMMLDVYQQIKEQEHIPQRTMSPAEVETHRLDT